MNIFKHRRKGRDGVIRESEHWYYKMKAAGMERLVCTHTADPLLAQKMADAAQKQIEQAKAMRRARPELSSRLGAVAQAEVKRIWAEVSQGQAERTQTALVNFRMWAGDDTYISDVSTEMLAEYQIKRKADGVSRGTMHKELGAVLRMLRHNGFMVVPPKNIVDKEQVVREFTPEELRRFFAAAEGTVFYNIWLMLMMSGRRLAELMPSSHKAGHSKHIPLLKEEIDLENRTMRVRFAKRRRGELVKMRDTAIPEEMVSIIEAQMQATPPEYPYLFPKMFGIPRAFDATLKRAGILKRDALGRKLVAHSLRHTWISMTYEQSKDPVMLKELTGHSSMKTLERYIHVAPQKTPISMAWLLREGGNVQQRANNLEHAVRPQIPEVIHPQIIDSKEDTGA